MKRLPTLLFFVFVLCQTLSAQPWKEHGRLHVSPANPHYLSFQDGTPFFYLACTGWEMLHRLDQEDINLYLDNRKRKGFNVVQTVIISEFMHMDKPTNFYGDSIFKNEDPLQPALAAGDNPASEPDYDFWDHVDYAVKTAEAKGLYLAVLPSWGEWVTPRTDKALFNSREQAYGYGWFLGNRYRNSPNLIWILGGDREPDERTTGVELWRAMAEGLADGTNGVKGLDGKADYSTTLMSFHAFSSSSTWFRNDRWIDFDMWGSYHALVNNSKAYQQAIADWRLPHPRPTVNGEPCYEGGSINYGIADNGFFTATDVRLAAYWSVFSGAGGLAYGADALWNFTTDPKPPSSVSWGMTWQQALDLPGATQVGYLKALLLSRPLLQLVPDQSMIVAGQGACDSRTCAIRGKSYAYVYIPTGNKTTVKLGVISGKKVKASWFDPRTGTTTAIGEFTNTGVQSFAVPPMSKELAWLRSGRGCDWVLVLEDAGRQ
jgi:hypothetical protein